MGGEVDLLRALPSTKRNIEARQHAKDPEVVRISRQYGEMYFDGPRDYGYGGYRYDGRWVPVARDIIAHFGLEPGQRVLDVGCGWGSFAMHAAANHDVHVVGITLSEPQAVLARRRAEERGLGERVDFRVMDYRELAGEPFDAVASIGMVEHVGSNQIDVYARQVARLVKPGGRVLNHGIARLRTGDPEAGPFSERYVFPDAAPLHLSRIQLALERAGLETEHVEGLRSDYAETLRHWAANIDDNLDEATRLAGPERIRVWRLYLRAARRGFESGFTSIYQVRCSRPSA
jgi:cyclopropane-fatty-acyl-phospholipid synthase